MNEDDIELILNNISTLNNGVTAFFTANPNLNKTASLNFLTNRLNDYIQDEDNRNSLYERLVQENYVKTKIKEIADEFGFYKEDLKSFYRTLFLKKIYEENIEHIDSLTNNFLDNIKDNMIEREFRYIKSEYKKIVDKTMYMTLKSGFSDNLTNVNYGVMVANAGDAAEFLFVSRAILSGYNCSSVDVRSSRYDAIIDYNGKLLRVQIKGISGNTISFKDRDRGGQGIDHTNETNRGQRITGNDCDIYVAVDKQIGILYIIPMTYVDSLSDDELNKNTQDLEDYKENWEIIQQVAEPVNEEIEE